MKYAYACLVEEQGGRRRQVSGGERERERERETLGLERLDEEVKAGEEILHGLVIRLLNQA